MKAFVAMAVTMVWMEPVFAAVSPVAPVRKAEFVRTLPVFSSGAHTNKHAVYQHEKFHAWIDSGGSLWVQPLDGGKPIGSAFLCFAVDPCYYAKGATYLRAVKDFQECGVPTLLGSNDGKVRIRGRLEEDIPFVVEYSCKGNSIRARGGCQDRPNIKPPTHFRLTCRFPPTHKFSLHTPTEEIREATKGMVLVLQPLGAASPTVYEFWQATKTERLNIPHTQIVVRGAYAPRVITFKPVGTEGRLAAWTYEGRSLWQGFQVLYRTQGQKINLAQNEVAMIIE